jgi:uncharacterized spore protein YtfJ
MEMVESLTKTTLGEIEKILNTRTIVGEPMTIGEVIIIPLISIGFGFGAGGGTGRGESKQKGEGAGSGTGGGAWVRPSAVVIIEKDNVRVESVKGGLSSAIQSIGESVPKMVENITEKVVNRKKEE